MDSSQTLPYRINVCLPDADNVFGPIITSSCRQGFDFTLLFEQSILSIVPSVVLLLLVPVRLFSLYRSSIKTVPDSMHGAKAVTAVLFAGLQLALLILWSKQDSIRTRASVPSAALAFIDALAICQLSYVEHTRSIRPSALLTIYLFLSIIFDVAQVRTLYLRNDTSSIAAVFSASIGIKAALFILEAQGKRTHLKQPYRNYPLESTSSIFNQSFFWWLNSLFIGGFRKLLSFDDLHEIDNKLLSEPLRNSMQSAWASRSKSVGKLTLPLAILISLRWPFLSSVFPRLCLIGFNYAQPFLISRIISFVGEPVTPESSNQGYGLIAAAAIIYTGIAISTVHYKHQLYRMITMFRGAVVGLIYNRTLGLQSDVWDESSAVTLMSTDVDRISNTIDDVHEIWARFIEVAIGVWLLARQLGWVCVMPIIVVFCSAVGSAQVAKRIGGRQRVWVAAVQRRIAMTSSMLGSMKSVKMMGLSGTMTTTIQAQRVRELDMQKGYRWMIVWLNVFSNVPFIFAPALTFVVFSIQAKLRGSDLLTINQAFTSLAIISLVTDPASKLLAAIPAVAAAMGCFDRIQNFLLAPSWDDQRREEHEEIRGLSRTKGLDGTKDIELQEIQKIPSKHLGASAVSVEQATICPNSKSEPALRNLSLRLAPASITMLLGPVGSGKSTLMKAILGELPCENGQIRVTSKRMAYCSQTPWLLNTSIQQSICGLNDGSAIDEEWYRTVMHACVLDQDMLQLPQGDRSVIGSRGLTLSGGQKQRLALARAVYARQDTILLDDVLSALDGKTERLVVDRLLGPRGLFRRLRTTVLLISHATRHLHFADQIVVLESHGQVAQRGTYESLRSQEGFISSILLRPAHVDEDSHTALSQASDKIDLQGPNDDDAMDLTRKTGDVTIYRYYLKSFGWFSALVFFGCAAASSFTLAFPQVWLKLWTDDNGNHIGKFISVYVLLAFFASFFQGAYIVSMLLDIGPKSSGNLHYILLRTVMRFSQDMTLVDGILPTCMLIVTTQALDSIAHAALISTGSTYMAITMPFLIIGIYALQKIYLRTSRQLRFMDLETKSPVYSHFLETLEGLSTIRAFGWQEQSRATNIKRLDASQKPYYLLYCVQRWLSLVLDLIIAALAVIVVALAVNLRSTTSAGLIGIALNNVLSFNQSLSSVVDFWTQLETSLGAIARLKTFEAKTVPEEKPGEDLMPPEEWPEKGSIEFRNVTATYDGSTISALQNVSMSIAPGQKVGICGRTGSGKSSLLLALLRLLDIDSGTIIIDNIDLRTTPRETLRSRLIAIPQDPFILSGSIRLNADPSSLIPDPLIIRALEKVHLWPLLQNRGRDSDSSGDSYGSGGGSGLDANMKSQPLSQGQQQLFCLARAMLRESKILILDEATSNVDTETDQLMQRVIREEFRQHTIVTVAHRLDTILDADVVVVMEGGRVEEVGSPGELLGRKESVFRELHGS